ncbi:hypothetical protein F4819DRAFT_478975 [Hypoxylon fuscum]|nr:hypothetical protein F4819DRAFT_478975 [Hypoxylon fuscum]
MPLPLLFSLRQLQGNMVAGGSNSLVLSAACHCYVPCPTRSEASSSQNGGSTDDIHNLEDEHSESVAEDTEDWEQKLQELSRSKLKWGAMLLPDHLAEATNDGSGRQVMHLGFGGESHDVTSPIEGEWYV